jgi:hypothetical protein
MPHSYFEAEGIAGLQKVYDRALAILEKHQPIPTELRDIVAGRIFRLASDGGHADDVILKTALSGLLPEAVLASSLEGSSLDGSGEDAFALQKPPPAEIVEVDKND